MYNNFSDISLYSQRAVSSLGYGNTGNKKDKETEDIHVSSLHDIVTAANNDELDKLYNQED